MNTRKHPQSQRPQTQTPTCNTQTNAQGRRTKEKKEQPHSAGNQVKPKAKGTLKTKPKEEGAPKRKVPKPRAPKAGTTRRQEPKEKSKQRARERGGKWRGGEQKSRTENQEGGG